MKKDLGKNGGTMKEEEMLDKHLTEVEEKEAGRETCNDKHTEKRSEK